VVQKWVKARSLHVQTFLDAKAAFSSFPFARWTCHATRVIKGMCNPFAAPLLMKAIVNFFGSYIFFCRLAASEVLQ
jgi:hypothetical protein